jgi:DNA-binding IclR family transcriptional regulator
MSPSERDPGPGAAEGALNRAAAILDAFDQAHRELTLAALVRRSGLPRSTVHRTADRMLRLGWLDKPDDRYRIGNRLFELSGLAPIRHELREAVLPFLQDLYRAVHTTVQLGVLDGPQVLIVEKITGHRAMPMLSQVGGTVPTHCSALGRTLLAHSAPEVVDRVLAAGMAPRTSRTITSPQALRAELAGILERGWAVDAEEGNAGVSCVAAPIFGPLGQIAAALSATGPTELVRPDRAGPTVRLAAAGASRAYSRRG